MARFFFWSKSTSNQQKNGKFHTPTFTFATSNARSDLEIERCPEESNYGLRRDIAYRVQDSKASKGSGNKNHLYLLGYSPFSSKRYQHSIMLVISTADHVTGISPYGRLQGHGSVLLPASFYLIL